MSFPLPAWARETPSMAPAPWAELGLGPRLASLAELVPRGTSVADVGADHALLAEALLRAGRATRALATDRAAAPLAAAAARLEGRAARPELRLGEGLEPLAPGEVEVVVLAGFGARKMRELLAAADLDSLGVRHLIVQPTAGLPGLRSWLAARSWGIDAERVVREGDRGFISSAWSPRPEPRALSPLEAMLGALEPSQPLLRAFLEGQRAHLARRGARDAALLAELERRLACSAP